MNNSDFFSICYAHQEPQVSWCGVIVKDGEDFDLFMRNEVASRLHDASGAREFEDCLRSLVATGFNRDNLEDILAAEIPEDRDWAVGEAIAEAYLSEKHGIIWPWNTERDKRTPRASLPGADLIGFDVRREGIRFALGEVKTSSDKDVPPNVMNGRTGMIHQLENLADNLGLINQLLKWLFFRCRATDHEKSFKAASTLFLSSGKKAVALFGVLVRDTAPDELDLRNRGNAFAKKLKDPTECQLVAVYLPCAVADLPARVSGGTV